MNEERELGETMTFAEAANRQHLYSSYYAVFLCGPAGEREDLGFTGRKSGSGLLKFLTRPSVQERIKQFPNADEITLAKKTATALYFSNGWRMEFGGTIRQESK